MTQHAKFAPSASGRWTVCHASVQECASAPETKSPYAEDGEEAHAVFTWAVENRVFNAWRAMALSGITMTYRMDDAKERQDSIQEALNYVEEWLVGFPNALVYVEQTVQFPSNVTEECWGRADVIIYIPEMQWLVVPDYKHGSGIVVEIEDNTQVGIYATGALEKMRGLMLPVGDVYTVIIQPRAFHAKSRVRVDVKHSTYYEDTFRAYIDACIARCLEPTPVYVPGPEQCRFCPARTTCKAVEIAALQVAQQTFKSVKDVAADKLPNPKTLPVDRIAFILQAAPLLRAWLDSVEELAYGYAIHGGHIPGQKLVESGTKRQWYGDPQNIATVLMQLIGTQDWDVVYPRKLITITEAESLVKAAFRNSAPRGKKRATSEEATKALAGLTDKKPSGKLKLVPVTEPGTPVTVTANTFNSVQGLLSPPEGQA